MATTQIGVLLNGVIALEESFLTAKLMFMSQHRDLVVLTLTEMVTKIVANRMG